jgi:hypothetical protein
VRPSWRGTLTPGPELADEAGHTNHEELVEVARRDRQEPELLKEGVFGVARFLQNTRLKWIHDSSRLTYRRGDTRSA